MERTFPGLREGELEPREVPRSAGLVIGNSFPWASQFFQMRSLWLSASLLQGHGSEEWALEHQLLAPASQPHSPFKGAEDGHSCTVKQRANPREPPGRGVPPFGAAQPCPLP